MITEPLARTVARPLFVSLLLVPLFLFSAVSQAASYTLYIKAGTHTVNGAGGTTLKVWGFTDNPSTGPMVPGPLLESQEGETVTVTVYNQNSRSHNFVVRGVTTDTSSISAGSNKTYSFTTPKAGVYLVSDTLNSNVNREMGLYGALIVRAAVGV
jgi:FtsP/CotA-like multicopper oxidase with cupredoxin domain